MATDDSPLDERLYSRPEAIEWYMGGFDDSKFRFPYMSENMIHHYFKDSPFFDWTTKNGLELVQAPNAWDTYQHVHDRKKFEAGLASRIGTEFMIVEGEDIQFDKEGNPVKGGVWVIRKQTRKKRWQQEDEVTVHASYFVVGENIYMAPRLSDMLACHIVSFHN